MSPSTSAFVRPCKRRARGGIGCAVTFAVLGSLPGALAAQQATPVWTASARPAPALPDAPVTRAPTWFRPIASAILPGSGQLLGGQDRGAIYFAVEGLLVIRFLSFQSEASRRAEEYRDLAFTVARAPYAPALRDTAFSYFEQMAKFAESGPIDTDEGDAFVPPEDQRSYNGSMWALAKRTFFADPDSTPDPESEEYQRALSFYRERAVGPNFSWSWRNAGLEQDLYRRTIQESDDRYRLATQQLGLLLANHLISAVDALISGQLSRNGRRVEVTTAVRKPSRRDGLQVFAVLRVAF